MSQTIYFDGQTRAQFTDLRQFSQTFTGADGEEHDKAVAIMRMPPGIPDGAVQAGIEARVGGYAIVELGYVGGAG